MKFLLFFIVALPCFPNIALIGEIESLRNSLPFKDAVKPKMTLRLADLYFEQARSAQQAFLLKGEGSQAETDKYHKRALELYQEALSGQGGLFPKPTGELAIKIHFQLARLHHRTLDTKTATDHYRHVVKTDHPLNDIEREANLGLAEIYEDQGDLATADTHYTKALDLCKEGGTCSYIHYRRSWVLYRNGKLEEAIAEIEKSLFDAKGQVKERSLQDYMLFLSNRQTDGMREIPLMESLQEKTGRDGLARELMEAYFGIGNRIAALNFLSYLNRRTPNLYDQIRMAEELYGFKMWGRLDSVLSQIEQNQSLPLSFDEETKKDSLKIFERIIVQLDAEREMNPQAVNYLQRSIMAFLNFFPKSENRNKMMQGWLTVETDNHKKIAQLKEWISLNLSMDYEKEAIDLRKTRLSLAEKAKDDTAYLEEALALMQYHGGKDEAKEREYSYAYAYKNYRLDKHDIALPIFERLSQAGERVPDKWAIQSQNLALDIYSKKKDYRAMISKSDTWLEQTVNWRESGIQRELDEMLKIKQQARFEYAASLGEQKEALDIFKQFCLNGEFKDKACTNAKVLAVKMKDQAGLISILEHLKDENTLLTEYELMGSFERAAPLYERLVLNKDASIENYMKAILLYELALDDKKRNQLIERLSQVIKRTKKMPENFESALYKMMKEANLFQASIFDMPWSESMKTFVARELESADRGNTASRRHLTDQDRTTGPLWAIYHLQKLEELDKAQRKIAFYGRRSKRNFDRRLKSLEKFKARLTSVVEGASTPTRVIAFEMAKRAYRDLATQIEATPLPEGLDEETIAGIKANLEQMAAPFKAESASYEQSKEEQLSKIDQTKNIALVESLSKTDSAFYQLVEDEAPIANTPNPLPTEEYRKKLAVLRDKPTDIAVLESIKNFLATNQQERMAAYFEGRIKSLDDQPQETL